MAQEYTVEQLNHGRKVYDFMRWDYWAFGISGLLLIAAIVIMGVRGFNWGLDFTGGTVIEITLEKPAEIDVMRDALQKAGFEEPMLQNFGSSHDIMVRMPPAEGETGGQVLGSQVLKVINESTNQNAAVKRIEFVGPSVGADLAQTGAMALMAALLSILVYVGFRFEWRLAAGVVIALAHDVIITLGILSLFHIEIDLTIVASLMSVIGYSLNDSIVVSDRIRENFRKIRRGTPYEIFNVSLTQTLHRTLITSGTTLMVILMLYLFGGPVLEGFSLTMLIGVSIGTASSIYVASALALKLGMKREHMLQQKVEKEGAPYEIFNVSLTQTLHRTLITSGTTLMVILMLYLFGGPVLEGFSLTMLIGVSIGTASSIYVASALALKLGMKREHMLQQKVEKEGADQPSILP